jgi:hypothetical protein
MSSVNSCYKHHITRWRSAWKRRLADKLVSEFQIQSAHSGANDPGQPACSPDLKALDYLISGYVRSKVNETGPANTEDLDESRNLKRIPTLKKKICYYMLSIATVGVC